MRIPLLVSLIEQCSHSQSCSGGPWHRADQPSTNAVSIGVMTKGSIIVNECI